MERKRANAALLALALLALLCQQLMAAPYDPPASYYNSATGTGSTLKAQLRTITSQMKHVSYGDARFSAPYTDADPNNPGNILLIYNRASVEGGWSTSPLIWNREHIWPDSRLGSASSSDQFNLRPANPTINSNRGNDPFGLDSTTGGYGSVGSYWYPGDADAGDVARSQFYMATRYSNLSLVEGSPSGTQMGDLSSLVNYHFRDVPDDFERRRNHAIYGLAGHAAPAIHNPYRQENRNPYVDQPEWVWSVFVDQQNDSQLYVGDAPKADGSSSLDLRLGPVIVGAPVPTAQNVTLIKMGLDGTYYEVTTDGLATSSVTGRMNAFPVITSGTGSRVLAVGLDTSTATPGAREGTVTINNLDITAAGGAGRGANDGDDTIHISLDVLAHANPSFSLTTELDTLSYDFGTVTLGTTAPPFEFDIANLIDTPGFTAALNLDSIIVSGDAGNFMTDLGPFHDTDSLEAGGTRPFFAALDTSAAGTFSATYTLSFSDEDLPGATNLGSLMLSLSGSVEAPIPHSADFNGDGDVDGRDFLIWQRGYSLVTTAAREDGDANGDGLVDSDDLLVWQEQYGLSPGELIATSAIPEPSTLGLGLVAASVLSIGRRRRGACK